jgi:hypothetical protein
MMVPIDYRTFLAIAAVILVGFGLAVWLIRAKTMFPAAMKIRKLGTDEINPDTASLFNQYDKELMALGFEKAGEFTVDGMENEPPHRVYVNAKQNCYAMLSELKVGLTKKGHLEFYTRFKGGGSLSSDQALVPNFLAVPKNRELHRLSATLSAEQLWKFHSEKLAQAKANGLEPKTVNKDQIYRDIQDDQMELMQFQIDSGLFERKPEQDFLTPTWKYSLFFMFKIVDPIPFGTSSIRLLIGALCCAATLAGFFLLARWPGLTGFLSKVPVTEHQLRYLAASLGAVCSGLIFGYLLRTRGVLWGGAISLLGYLLINQVFPNPFVEILICAYAGLVGNRIFEYRQTKVLTRLTGPLIALVGLLLVGWFMLEKSIVP